MARVLKARLGDGVRFVGIGGEKMAAQGIVSPFEISELSILGILEGVAAYGRVVKRANEAAALAVREQPDVAVLIDSWGFTLRVATRLRKQLPKLPLIKYVGPQVWASRPGRAKTLAAAVDHLLSIHVFDAPYFEAEGLPVTFVGNTAVSIGFETADPARLRAHIGAGREDPILLVLPGSRPAEIAKVLPAFEDALRLIKATHPHLHVVVPAASTVADEVSAKVASWPFRAHVLRSEELKRDAMVASTAALACSGTVTTELALAGCPMVVGYRIGAVTYAVLKLLLRTPYVTLFNIAAGRYVAPEFLQDRCTGPLMAKAVSDLLDDPESRARQSADQFAALDKMGRGGPDPAERAADVVMDYLKRR
ncbi:MAG: lipid-A-disaccharide synthase [Pseudomonadota bacterium]